MAEVADLYVVLRANYGQLTAGMSKAAAESEAAGARIRGSVNKTAAESESRFTTFAKRGVAQMAFLGAATGAAVVGIGVKSLEMGMKFQAATERIRTQAGATQAEVDKVRPAIMSLAGQVGFGPQSLAEAFFHAESAGYRSAKALDVVRYSAELAKVGHSDLTSTTNVLVGLLQNGIPNGAGKAVAGMSQMAAYAGTVNSIVGAGNMTMSDLIGALSSGIAGTAKTFGMSLASIGAPLAVLTDEGVPAAAAATRLRMSISLMGAPTKIATKYLMELGLKSGDAGHQVSAMQAVLQKSGVQSTTLANDLRKPNGFLVALQDIKTHMHTAGLSADESAALISRAFGGGRSGAAIMQLYTNLNLLKSKFGQIQGGAGKFGDDWKTTLGTLQSGIDRTKARVEAWMTSLGEKLIPYAARALQGLNSAFDWLGKHMDIVKPIVVGVLVAMGLALAPIAISAAITAASFLLMWAPIIAVGAGIYELYQHSAKFRQICAEVVQVMQADLKKAMTWLTSTALPAAKRGLADVVAWWQQHRVEIGRVAAIVGGVLKTGLTWLFQTALPAVVGGVRDVVGWFVQHRQEMGKIASTIGGVLKATFTWLAFTALPAMEKAWRVCWNAVSDIITWFINNPVKWVQQQIAMFQKFWSDHGAAMMQIAQAEWAFIWTTIKVTWDIIWGFLQVGFQLLSDSWKTLWDLVGNLLQTAWDLISGTLHTALQLFLDAVGLFADLLTGKWSKLWADTKKLVTDAFTNIYGVFTKFGSDALNLLKQAGSDVITGLINGVKAGASGVVSVIKSVGSDIVNGVKSFFGIKSPSTVMAGLGGHLMTGLAQGILKSGGDIPHILGKVFGKAGGGAMRAFGLLKGAGAGLLKSVFGSALGDLRNVGSDVMGALSSLFGGGGGGGGSAAHGSWASTIAQALGMAGAPAGWGGDIAAIIQHESGGNPNAINNWDSNAKAGHPSQGLMQTIPGTFMAYAGSLASRGITNPLANIYAGIRYIMATYGSVFNVPGIRAMAGGGAYQGYNDGGVVPGTGNTDTVHAKLTPGEFIVTNNGSNLADAMSHFGIGVDRKPPWNKGKHYHEKHPHHGVHHGHHTTHHHHAAHHHVTHHHHKATHHHHVAHHRHHAVHHPSYVAHHKELQRWLNAERRTITADGKNTSALGSWLGRDFGTKKKAARFNPREQALFRKDWNKDERGDLRSLTAALQLQRRLAHDKHATAGERHSAASEVAAARRVLERQHALWLRFERTTAQYRADMAVIQKAKAAAALHKARARHVGKHAAEVEDLPSYLAAMAHAGRASSFLIGNLDGHVRQGAATGSRREHTGPVHTPLGPVGHHGPVGPAPVHHAPVHSGPPVIHVHIDLDGTDIATAVRKATLKYERRNVSNGLSRYTTR